MKILPLLIALFAAAPLLAEDAPETPACQRLRPPENTGTCAAKSDLGPK